MPKKRKKYLDAVDILRLIDVLKEEEEVWMDDAYSDYYEEEW